MERSDAADAAGGAPGNKAARLLDRYELDDVAAELERGWTATGEAHRSLRELADYFNRQLLAHRLQANAQQTLKGEVETLYALLTDDDVSDGDRVRARRRLEQVGVDVDALLDEFVSYQTIRRYLTDHRDATYSPAETDQVEKAIEDLQRLRGRVEAVTEGKLETLRETDRLSLGDFRVTVDVQVYCEACGTQHRVDDLLAAGGCECRRE